MVALEADDHAAVNADHEAQRDVGADDEEQRPARRRLLRRELVSSESRLNAMTQDQRIRHRADRGVDDRERAQNFVERPRIAPRPVLRDETHQRAAIAEVEHREIRGERRRQHPQPVRRHAEVREVERQHDEAEDGVDEVREVARRDVVGHDRRRCPRRRPSRVELGASWRRRRVTARPFRRG